MAIHVIHTVQEFLDTLQIGGRFWFMEWFNEVGPTEICGPAIITAFDSDRRIVNYKLDGSSYSGHIADLTNGYHGVFLNEEDAQAYFEQEKERYATDPKLIAQLARNREEHEIIREMEDECKRDHLLEDW